jgi:kojibiose phosphorylase
MTESLRRVWVPDGFDKTLYVGPEAAGPSSRLRHCSSKTRRGAMDNQFAVDDLNSLLSDERWLVHQDRYEPELNRVHETTFTLANGYMGTRGLLEEGTPNEYPGNFIAGVFDVADGMSKSIVNTPHWLGLRLYLDNHPLTPDTCQVVDFGRTLDMQQNVLFRRLTITDPQGRDTLIEGYRFLSRSDVHRAAIKWYVTPLNYDSLLMLESILDGSVVNDKDTPRFRVKLFRIVENSDLDGRGCYLEVGTKTQDTRIGVGAITRVRTAAGGGARFRRLAAFGERRVEYCEFDAVQGQTVEIEKRVVTYTSQDVAKPAVKAAVIENLDAFAAEGIEAELARHTQVYENLWRVTNARIEGDERADKALRFSIFQLMNVVNEDDPNVNVGAKGLHGDFYKGLTFWDTEVYLLPFFAYTWPAVARNLVTYRYRLLDGARRNATEHGYRGAMYPWNSADTGKEEASSWALDIRSGELIRWYPERELHVVAAVAYGVHEYCRITEDLQFLLNCGAEILFETARFWASRLEYDAAHDRYEITNVIGPDEFHIHVDNNFYTNYMAGWNMRRAFALAQALRKDHPSVYADIATRIGLSDRELEQWSVVQEKIYYPGGSTGLIEQFDGYFDLEDYVIQAYDENNVPRWPEGVEPSEYRKTQLTKQPDVVMVQLLLPEEFDEETKRINYEYYEQRTMHLSSLSSSSSALMGLRLGDDSRAYQAFLRSAEVDLVDNLGNTALGLHVAAAGGTWQVAIMGFAGMRVDPEGELRFEPQLPEHWESLSFQVVWRGKLLGIDIRGHDVEVKTLDGETPAHLV